MADDAQVLAANLHALTVREIAPWALPHTDQMARPKPLAVLPKLQRSPAWKAEQIERLWDSLVRGFPIGSFLVSPYGKRDELGEKGFALQNARRAETLWAPEPDDWHLLDGQQRATAIAIGFFNPWTNPAHRTDDLRYALWVDLEPADDADERVFIFRVLTRSHPWGYQRLAPSKPLTAPNRRRAAEEFEKANKCPLTAGRLPLAAIPFDAKAPVPLPLLVESLGEGSPWQGLRGKMEQIWRASEAPDEPACRRSEQRTRVETFVCSRIGDRAYGSTGGRAAAPRLL